MRKLYLIGIDGLVFNNSSSPLNRFNHFPTTNCCNNFHFIKCLATNLIFKAIVCEVGVTGFVTDNHLIFEAQFNI